MCGWTTGQQWLPAFKDLHQQLTGRRSRLDYGADHGPGPDARHGATAEQRHLLDVGVRADAVRTGRGAPPGAVAGDADVDVHHDIRLYQDGMATARPVPGTGWCCGRCTAGGPPGRSGPAARLGATSDPVTAAASEPGRRFANDNVYAGWAHHATDREGAGA
jgi:hypothetical protein